MNRRPAPAWIDLARGDALPAGEPAPEGTEAPSVDAPHRGENDNVGMMPSLGLSAGGRSALLPGKPARGRRLGVTIALILSTAIHAAAFAWLAGNLPPEGMEAQSEGVSVEIVFDVPATSASPAIAGNDGAADAVASEVVEQALAEVVEPETIEASRPEAVEPVETGEEAAVVEPHDPPPLESEAVDDAVAEIEPAVPEPALDVERVEPAEPPRPAEILKAVEPSDSVADAERATEVANPIETAVAEPAVTEPAEPVVGQYADGATPVAPAPETAAPALAAPPPDAATIALLATPPMIEAAPHREAASDDADQIDLPETVARVPETRPASTSQERPAPETKAAKAKATDTKTAAPAASRPAPSTPPTRAVDRTGKSDAEKATANARTSKRPADAGRKPAAAASAGSQARAAAAPGAEAKYGRKLLSHVERHKRYPAAAFRAGISGATRLAITIDRSGGLAGARVSASSGHQILDQEALAVARRAAPYPRPPDGVGGSTFSVSVTLRFTR